MKNVDQLNSTRTALPVLKMCKMMNTKIIRARITAMPKSLFDPMPQVFVTLEDGKEQYLFDYYPDEISFTAGEFAGLTIEQARHLKFTKDRNYLTS